MWGTCALPLVNFDLYYALLTKTLAYTNLTPLVNEVEHPGAIVDNVQLKDRLSV